MSSFDSTSTLVKYQLPEFIRSDHPTFVEFVQKYYEYLEQPGNALYELKRFQDSYDIDTARGELLTHFKSMILPSFPEKSELSTERIIKASRDFYAKKGTPDSFKFLFRVLYDLDLEVFFPKLQILKASDGKWMLPQSFKLTLSVANYGVDINKLEGKKGYGSISRASCVVESAVRTIDKGTGREIVEIYVSDVNRLFLNGEYLEIEYMDEFNVLQVFSEKIIGSISNIKINPKRRGTKYKTGDPVIINGGLDAASETAVKATAVVGNVTTGSIDAVTILKGGYGFRTTPNSLIDIISANGYGGNVIVTEVDTGNGITIPYCTDSILYKKNSILNVSDYDFDNAIQTYSNLTIGAGNTTTAVNLATTSFLSSPLGIAGNTVTDYYKSMKLTIVAGTGYNGTPNSATITAYNGTTKIATLSNALGIAPGATSNVALSSNSNTTLQKAFSFDSLVLGEITSTITINGGNNFDEEPILDVTSVYNTDYSLYEGVGGFIEVASGEFNTYNNVNSSIKFSGSGYSSEDNFYNGWRLHCEKHFRTITDYDGATKTAFLSRPFEINVNQSNILSKNLYLDPRPSIQYIGRIAAIEILNGGSGYSSGDTVNFIGTGYGAAATLTVSAGEITDITITNRGEGYPIAPDVSVTSTGGSGAAFKAYLLSDGEDFDINTGKIGQIKDIVLVNRGSDYTTTPNVSLKIYDLKINPDLNLILENDIVYQGPNINSTTFKGTVDAYYSSNNLLRVFNYSGAPVAGQNLVIYKTSTANINASVLSQNVDGKTYPFRYGDGKAKANAEFLNGLIRYNGYYINTDGQVSSDKKLQSTDKYHNFSYSLISEGSFSKYAKTVYDTLHPAGTQIIPVHVIKNDMVVYERANINTQAIILTSNSLTNNCNVGYGSVQVTGQAENFDTVANTNDLIIINSSNTDRMFAKVITSIANNNSLNVESACILIGQGRASTNANNAVIQISGNSNSLPVFIDTSDRIMINIGVSDRTYSINSISGNTITLNSNAGITTSNTNLMYQVVPQFNVVDYLIIRTSQQGE
jgi:hypothetical protein